MTAYDQPHFVSTLEFAYQEPSLAPIVYIYCFASEVSFASNMIALQSLAPHFVVTVCPYAHCARRARCPFLGVNNLRIAIKQISASNPTSILPITQFGSTYNSQTSGGSKDYRDTYRNTTADAAWDSLT